MYNHFGEVIGGCNMASPDHSKVKAPGSKTFANLTGKKDLLRPDQSLLSTCRIYLKADIPLLGLRYFTLRMLWLNILLDVGYVVRVVR